MSDDPIDVVCAIIRDEQHRYLATRRPPGKMLAGLWEFPGGKVHPGESPEEALVREIREELAVTVAIDRPLASVLHEYPEVRIRLIPFLARITRGSLVLREHTESRWVTPADFDTLPWAPADRPILDGLRREP